MANSVEWADLEVHRLDIVEPNTELANGSATAAGEWAVVAAGCALAASSRAQLRAALATVVDQLDSYSLAEHENGYHNGLNNDAGEPGCPACEADVTRPVTRGVTRPVTRHGVVYLVQRETFDGLYLFAHEDQRDAYAQLFPDVATGECGVLDRSSAATLIAGERQDQAESSDR